MEGGAFNGDAEGDECVVYGITTVTLGGVLVGAGDGKVSEVGEAGECLDKGGDVCCCVEDLLGVNM